MSTVERATCEWENQSDRFKLPDKTYKAQYAQMYYARLMELSTSVQKAAKEKWPSHNIAKILCLEDGADQVAVGTLYKDMKLKPTVLKEYTENRTMAAQLGATGFMQADDGLILEDESARIRLTGRLVVDALVTGVVLAVRGVYDAQAGVMDVQEFTYAGLPPQIARPPVSARKCIAIVSGLAAGDPSVDAPRLMLLLDWMKGLLGDTAKCQSVARLVICGGTLGSSEQLATAPAASKQQRFAMEAVQAVDRCVTELASALPVDLMPGPEDLSNHSLPQQPLHRCLFPGAAPYESFHRVTNPYRFAADGVQFLGTAGQNVADVQRYSDVSTQQAMKDSLQQRHLCCTAPDTLACYPFVNADPFILHTCPHVYFVGNQQRYTVGRVEGKDGQAVVTIGVPAFAVTGAVVLVDLATLECQQMTFDVSL